MSDRIVLAYGDSNTHGTMPMANLEDTGRFGPPERWPGSAPPPSARGGA